MGGLNMATFAEIRTDNNEVIRIVTVSDKDVAANGGDLSTEAETWVSNNVPNDAWLLENEFDNNYPDTYWKQSFKDNSNRIHRAVVGGLYLSEQDGFTPEPSNDGMTFNTTNWRWE